MLGVFLVSSGLAFEERYCVSEENANNFTGEDALANLSIEKTSDGTISGFVRIRSRSQGLALSLGSLKGLKAGTY